MSTILRIGDDVHLELSKGSLQIVEYRDGDKHFVDLSYEEMNELIKEYLIHMGYIPGRAS